MPIHAISKQQGRVVITKYANTPTSLTTAIVQDIVDNQPTLSGSICVLVETNDDASAITGLLQSKGFAAKLIQDNNKFNLYNLLEIRYLIDCLQLSIDRPTISQELWQQAQKQFVQEFSMSIVFEYVQTLIQTFEQTRPQNENYYKSDFLQFIQESQLEDFVTQNNQQIFVSTIHKAKGKEFDNVFLLLKKDCQKTNAVVEENIRKVYVAITRAKQNLYIHCDSNYFDEIEIDKIEKVLNHNSYDEPSEYSLQASMRDVYLDGFYSLQEAINTIKSADILQIKSQTKFPNGDSFVEYYCTYRDKTVVKFSKDMCKKIDNIIAKGYKMQQAIVRFVVYWQKLDTQNTNEIKIILPDIKFTKESRI